MRQSKSDTKEPAIVGSASDSPVVGIISRAACEVLAERTGVLAPGETLSDELMAFAEAVARMAVHGGHGEGGTG